MEVTGQVWDVFPIGKYEDVAAGGGVSVGVCIVYGMFQSLFESVGVYSGKARDVPGQAVCV